MDDFELLDRWRAGDAAAGNQLFERHFDSLYRFLSRKIDGDAADLVQRTLLGCVEARDRFRGEASFRTFLFAIARNELYGYWRQRKKRNDLDFSVSSLEDLGPTPSRVVAKRREHVLLLEALKSIPLDLQIAVELHYWEGLRGPELARVLEIPEGTVRSRVRRAKEALREKMMELAGAAQRFTVEDIESSMATLGPVVVKSA